MDVKCKFTARNEDYFIHVIPEAITITPRPEQKGTFTSRMPISYMAVFLCLGEGVPRRVVSTTGGHCLHMQIARRKRVRMNSILQFATGNVSKPYAVEIRSIFHN